MLLFLFYILFMFPTFFICFLPFLFLSVTQLLKFEQQTFFLPFSCPLVSLTLNSRSLILSLNLFHFKFFFAVSSIITHLFPFPFLSLFFHCFNFPFLRVFIFFLLSVASTLIAPLNPHLLPSFSACFLKVRGRQSCSRRVHYSGLKALLLFLCFSSSPSLSAINVVLYFPLSQVTSQALRGRNLWNDLQDTSSWCAPPTPHTPHDVTHPPPHHQRRKMVSSCHLLLVGTELDDRCTAERIS